VRTKDVSPYGIDDLLKINDMIFFVAFSETSACFAVKKIVTFAVKNQ
jgi:hypothetical protein